MDAISTRFNEIKVVSELALDQTSKIFTQALGMTQQELAGAMKVWLEAPLDQPADVDEKESLAIGHLTSFYLHSILCDAVEEGNISGIVEAVGDFQTLLFRLAGAGLVVDPNAVTGQAIADTRKQSTKNANEKWREKGEETRQNIIEALKTLSNKNRSQRSIAKNISNKTGIKENTVLNYLPIDKSESEP